MCNLVQVNGVSVVGHKHQDVVDMIKDSSHVTLTVISKVAANGSHRSEFCLFTCLFTCLHGT